MSPVSDLVLVEGCRMTDYFRCNTILETMGDALPLFGKDQFASPTRSTIPMLTMLRHRRDLFNKIIGQMGFSGDYDLCLEHPVSPPLGEGKASCTDVMITAGTSGLAIEGKWTEPMYETVGEWLNQREDQTSRRQVLQGWLSLLQPHVEKTLDLSDFDSVIYQMLHRAASAATAEQPVMAYFQFKPSPDPRTAAPNETLEKLSDLWNQLGGPTGFPFYLVEIEIHPTDAYAPLRMLAKGDKSTAKIVRAALEQPVPLLSFSNVRSRKVGS